MAEKNYNLERLNILVVDDNKHMCTLVETILRSLGVGNMMVANDGADAFKVMRHFPADIIICDWNMEPLDGIDFTKMIRTGDDSPNPFVPIIMLTGHTEINRVQEARDAGINEFLAKPISAKSIYSRICKIIDRPRPFIRTKSMFGYFGPDRRRRNMPEYMGPERRKENVPELKEASASEMSQSDIDDLLNS